MSTDDDWEKWGQRDPYFGVITLDRFRMAKLDETARTEFFETGRWHVEYVWTLCRRYVDAGFAPRTVLDFGCGVGRMLMHFARDVEQVVGVDISSSMLKEARRNCEVFGAGNVAFAASIQELPAGMTQFDLVHSVIVLQHLDPERGLQVFAQLLAAIAPGGIGAIQVTHAKMVHASNLGVSPVTRPVPESVRNLTSGVRKRRLLAKWFERGAARPRAEGLPGADDTLPVARPPEGADPEMQMNSYNLNQLFFLLQRAGVPRFHSEFTDHGGELGVFLFFQKPREPGTLG